MDGSDVRVGPALYERILGDVRARILSGEWPPGHRIPSEHEFTIAYDCSRMTVSKALTRLAGAGLIERRRRAGSFVARPQSQSAVLKISDVGAEVAELGLRYRHEIRRSAIRRATRRDHDLLGVAAGTGLLEIDCRHFAGDTPFCLEHRVVSLAAVPEAAGQDFRDLAPGAWLVAHVPWTRAEHRICATSASREVAKAMGVQAGAACLVVVRRTWRDAIPVTRVELTYDSSHVIVARFTPAGTF